MALLLAAASFVYLLPFRAAVPFLDPDEGIILQGAVRILRGEVPYRDFFTFYTPAAYYWNALLFRLFGASIVVAHTVLQLYGALFSALTYVLARRLGSSRSRAALASGLLLVCCLPVRFLVMHNWDATVTTLLALYFAIRLRSAPSNWWAALLGGFSALTVLFNQARGAGLLLGLVLAWVALKALRLGAGLGLRSLGWAALFFTLPLAATAGYFAAHHAFSAMVQDLLWANRHYSAANSLPYGYITMRYEVWRALFVEGSVGQLALSWFIASPALLLCALPPLVVLMTGLCMTVDRKRLPPEQLAVVVLAGCVLLGSLLPLWVTRPDFHHLTFLAPLFFFLLPWMLGTWIAPYRSLVKWRPVIAVYVLVAFSAYGLTLLWSARNCTTVLQTRRGTVRTLLPNETIPYVQAHVPSGSQLVVHPYLPLYLFLTRTYSPLRFEYLMPGMNTEKQFREAASELAAARTPVVLFENQFIQKSGSAWPHIRLVDVATDPMADYIVRHYRMCKSLDQNGTHFLFMVRNDLPCPADQP